jgi:hypothetical protein
MVCDRQVALVAGEAKVGHVVHEIYGGGGAYIRTYDHQLGYFLDAVSETWKRSKTRNEFVIKGLVHSRAVSVEGYVR